MERATQTISRLLANLRNWLTPPRSADEERSRLLAHALRSVNDCVSITDVEDRFLYVNEAFCRTYGYTQSELQGQHVGILRTGRSDPRVLEQILPTTLTEGWQGELWNRSKDGREFPIALTIAPVRAYSSASFGSHNRTIADEATPMPLARKGRLMATSGLTPGRLRRKPARKGAGTLPSAPMAVAKLMSSPRDPGRLCRCRSVCWIGIHSAMPVKSCASQTVIRRLP